MQGVLQACHSAQARYLFQQDKFYDTAYDTGDLSVQCGRKVDVLKLWLMWRAYGHRGLQAHIDGLFQKARYVGSTEEQSISCLVVGSSSIVIACWTAEQVKQLILYLEYDSYKFSSH